MSPADNFGLNDVGYVDSKVAFRSYAIVKRHDNGVEREIESLLKYEKFSVVLRYRECATSPPCSQVRSLNWAIDFGKRRLPLKSMDFHFRILTAMRRSEPSNV